MRILLSNRWYPIGGVGNYVRILAKALADLGHQVIILTAKSLDGAPKLPPHTQVNVHTIAFPFTPYQIRRLPTFKNWHRTIETFIYARRVHSARKRLELVYGKFDVVEYAEVDSEGLFHSRDDESYVVKLHMPAFAFKDVLKNLPDYSTPWMWQWEKQCILNAAGICSPSRDLAARVAKYCGLNPSEIEIIPNPLDLTEFYPVPNDPNPEPEILFVGNLEERKGAFVMAEAIPIVLQRYPSAKFTFVGAERTLPSGQSGAALVRQLAGAGHERIHFTGFIDHARLRALVWKADVCATPAPYENCPYGALEIMACGKPLVATRGSGFQEIIRDGETGLLFTLNSPQDLAAKILALLDDTYFAACIGNSASKFVAAEFEAHKIAQQQVAFYSSVM